MAGGGVEAGGGNEERERDRDEASTYWGDG